MKRLAIWPLIFSLFFGVGVSTSMAGEQPAHQPKENRLSYKNMVLITEGEFPMGSGSGNDDEIPVHTVYVKPFYIDKYEVTNRQFKEFVRANPQWNKQNIPDKYHDGEYLKHWIKGTYPPHLANHPVVYVSWYAAKAYAEWRNKRLPTEAEWEKAACYNLLNKKMLVGYKYKWGFGEVFNPRLANTAHYNGLPVGGLWKMWWDVFSADLMQKILAGETTTPVGKFAPGVNNLYDTTGNVWEWCLDWYRGDSYKVEARRERKREKMVKVGQERGFDYLYEPAYGDKESLIQNYRVLRGGSWANKANITRSTNRFKFKPNFTDNDIGFRCVADYIRDKSQRVLLTAPDDYSKRLR